MEQMDIHVESPSGKPCQKSLVKCSENIYADEDKTPEQKRPEPALSAAVDTRVQKRSLRAAAVILGLLCLLLLTGLITLVVMFGEMDMFLLHTNFNNLTQERDQLQTSYYNLTQERDQLLTSYYNLTRERDQLQTSNNMLTKERDQLQTSNNILTKERDQLQTSNNMLTKERDQLQTSNNMLTKERDQLQTSYNRLATEKNRLQERFDTLTRGRNDLQRKLQDTEASLKKLIDERAELELMLMDSGWVYYGRSFYQVSIFRRIWKSSRDDCRHKGADLMIINSEGEQNFVNEFKQPMWIGLTDSETEGTWKWVDGTPVTQSYWDSGEPNGGTQENCGQIMKNDALNSWNDVACDTFLFWICEKKLFP